MKNKELEKGFIDEKTGIEYIEDGCKDKLGLLIKQMAEEENVNKRIKIK